MVTLGLMLLYPAFSSAQGGPRQVPRPSLNQRVENHKPQVPRPPNQTAPRQGNVVGRPPSETRLAPGPHAGDWLRSNMNLTPQQQREKLQSDPGFQKLPAEQQRRLTEQLDRFNSMNANQKQRWLDRMEWMEHLPEQQHQQVQQMQRQMQQLDPSRRQAIRRALVRMRDLSPEERHEMIDSPQIRSNFSEQERQIMHGVADVRMPKPGEDVPRPPQQ